MAITVHRHGVHYRWTQDLPGPLRHQLDLGNALWNELVRSHEQLETDRAAIWSSYPQVAAMEQVVAELDARCADLGARVADHKRTQRTTRPKHPDVAALRDAKAALKAAREQRRDAIVAVRDDATERLRAVQDAAWAREKAMYSVFGQGGGYWGSFNDIVGRRFKPAVQRVGAARKEGRPAQLRTRRPDGTGSITVQLQRTAGQPPRTPEMIADDDAGKWRNVLHIPGAVDPQQWDGMTRAQQRHAGRQTIRMRAGQDDTGRPVWLDVPVQIHRQLPPDADITEARLTVRRVGPDLRAAVTVVAKIPDPEPNTTGPDVALHLGWLNLGDDGIQVATWRATAPIDVPERLRGVLRPGPDRTWGTVVVPAVIDQRLAGADKRRGERDDALNVLKAALARWTDTNGPLPNPYDPGEPVTAGKLGQWRSPSRFVVLARHLAALADPSLDTPIALLQDWARDDRRAWRSQEHGRDRILAHRDDLYRNVAAVLAGPAARLIVDDTSIAVLARRDPDSDLPTDVQQAVSRRRGIAAPGRLRQLCAAATTREGGTVVTVSARDLTREHTCGHVNTDTTQRPITCGGCRRTYDPDANATALMLRRAVPSATT